MSTHHENRERRPPRKLGEFLRFYRKRKGLTQEQAAQAANISLRQWQRIEAEESGTEPETVPALASAVDAPLRETYERANFRPPPQVERGMSDSEKAASIVEALPAEIRQYAMSSLLAWDKLSKSASKQKSGNGEDKETDTAKGERHPAVSETPAEVSLPEFTQEELSQKPSQGRNSKPSSGKKGVGKKG